MRRIGVVMFAFMLLALFLVSYNHKEDSAKASAKSSRPNVVIIVTDDQPDGTMNMMPATRRLFSQGITYPNGYASTGLCCPARASIMTGQHVHNHNIWTNDEEVTSKFPHKRSLQWNLQKAGYRTALFGKFLNGWEGRREAPGWSVYKGNKGLSMQKDYAITSWAKQFVAQSKRRPWFMLLGYHSPHYPWSARNSSPWQKPEYYNEQDLSDKPLYIREKAARNRSLGLVRSRFTRNGQTGELRALDPSIASLFRFLRKQGEDRNTLAFFISDQGYLWGQHNGLMAKQMPYREVLEVPFYMRWPARFGSSTDTRLASSVDIAPTIYQATRTSINYTVDGRSLLGNNTRDWLFSEMYRTDGNDRWSAYITEDKVYIKTGNQDPWEEFYDMGSDPWQLRSDTSGITSQMRADLLAGEECKGTSCH